MNLEERVAVVEAYADILRSAGSIVIRESQLPFSKDDISEVILSELKTTEDKDIQDVLIEAFMRLELFLPDEQFEPVSRYLELLGDLADMEGEPSEIFQTAAEQVPTTNEEVHAIFDAIDERIQQRKQLVESL